MRTNNKLLDFIHPKLGQEITAIGGHYVISNENRLPYNNREVLYLTGYAVADTSCCAVGGCAYALVPGFILNWKYKKNSDDLPVSYVEPVWDFTDQQEIRCLIQQKEMIQQVSFH